MLRRKERDGMNAKILLKNELLDKPEYKAALDKIPDIMLLGYGGSIAYGTNIPASDVDIRGIFMNSPADILGVIPDEEQYDFDEPDITVYNFKKMVKLLTVCNPNTIEILGLRRQEYLFINEYGQTLLDNKRLFLSKKAIYTFGNYALSQLNRLMNKSGREKEHVKENEQRSLEKAILSLGGRYRKCTDKNTKVSAYIEDGEILLNAHFEKVPVETAANIFNELHEIHKNYGKSARNRNAVEHKKLSKHMMHLLRLYMMGIDILENEEIITYRENEHDLLMSVRNGEYLETDGVTPTRAFEALLNDYKKRFEHAVEVTRLPELPDTEKINRMVMEITRGSIIGS